MNYLLVFLGGCIAALVAYVLGRRRANDTAAEVEARRAAEATRARLEADLKRQDDAAVQRDAMEGVKPLPPGMGGP